MVYIFSLKFEYRGHKFSVQYFKKFMHTICTWLQIVMVKY